jgi:hypothetical protein
LRPLPDLIAAAAGLDCGYYVVTRETGSQGNRALLLRNALTHDEHTATACSGACFLGFLSSSLARLFFVFCKPRLTHDPVKLVPHCGG